MATQTEARPARLRVGLWVLGCSIALLAVVKVFAADVYRVKSGSMRPTIFGGEEGRSKDKLELSEWVLVNYTRRPAVARFDLVVLEGELSPEPLVKRVAGLPSEKVAIVGGDLLVDGRRLPPDEARPAPVLLFDDAVLPLREHFRFAEPRWRQVGEHWNVDASQVGAGNYAETLMQYAPDLTDGYLRSDGTQIEGLKQVNDGILALELRVGDTPTGRVLLELLEEGDLFRAEFRFEPEGARLRVLRRNDAIQRRSQSESQSESDFDPEHDELGWLVLRDERVAFEPDVWHRVRFANIDNHLLVRLDGLEFVASYEANAPYTAIVLGQGKRSVGTRVRFGADRLAADFRRVRIYRDLYWTESGDHGTQSPYVLGPDELFLLGDNSTYSTDSRTFGAVPLREVLGRPVAVVWPPRSARRLEGASGERP